MWRKDSNGEERKAVDIQSLKKALETWFNPIQKHDAGEILRFVIKRLIEEEVPAIVSETVADLYSRNDTDVLNYFNSSKISK